MKTARSQIAPPRESVEAAWYAWSKAAAVNQNAKNVLQWQNICGITTAATKRAAQNAEANAAAAKANYYRLAKSYAAR